MSEINYRDLPKTLDGYWVVVQKYKTSTKKLVRSGPYRSSPTTYKSGQTKGSFFISLKAEITVKEWEMINNGDFFDGSAKIIRYGHGSPLKKVIDDHPIIEIDGWSYKCMPLEGGRIPLEIF